MSGAEVDDFDDFDDFVDARSMMSGAGELPGEASREPMSGASKLPNEASREPMSGAVRLPGEASRFSPPARKEVLPVPVGYYSLTRKEWMPAFVMGYDKKQGKVLLDVNGVPKYVLPDRVGPLPPGTPVEYYSDTRKEWIRAVVKGYDKGTYELKPTSFKDVLPDDKVPLPPNTPAGTPVEYYSDTRKEWIKAVVQGYDSVKGTYELKPT